MDVSKDIKLYVSGVGTVKIPIEIAELIPFFNLSKSFNESNIKVQFEDLIIEDETKLNIIKAIEIYLVCKKDKYNEKKSENLDKIISKLKPKEWSYLMIITHKLADFDFFNDSSISLPTLDVVADGVFMMPEEYMNMYINIYLKDCLEPECSCERRNHKNYTKIENAKKWWKSLPKDQVELYKKVYFGIFNRPVNWLSLDRDIKINLIAYFHNSKRLPECKCLWNMQETSFYTKWHLFNTTHPNLARFIWNNMNREELLYISGKIPSRRFNGMKKSTFEDMSEYVERFRPKDFTYDPIEYDLKREVVKAKHNYYSTYNKESIIFAENRLKEYQKGQILECVEFDSEAIQEDNEFEETMLSLEMPHLILKFYDMPRFRIFRRNIC